ncbi:MAG: DUF1294 domain-containing protein [Lachnospiraceae bacterium]|nr:DUF1294 domain-containing protein [Lachnospiraceae bacterium]
MDVIWIIAAYLAAVNIIAFTAMGADKWKAMHHAWRIPEAVLFLVVILGGSLGGFLAMHIFRHKTRHWYFRYGFPVILALHLIAGAYLIGSGNIVIM